MSAGSWRCGWLWFDGALYVARHRSRFPSRRRGTKARNAVESALYIVYSMVDGNQRMSWGKSGPVPRSGDVRFAELNDVRGGTAAFRCVANHEATTQSQHIEHPRVDAHEAQRGRAHRGWGDEDHSATPTRRTNFRRTTRAAAGRRTADRRATIATSRRRGSRPVRRPTRRSPGRPTRWLRSRPT